jgi:glucose 1-dehydrogenase
VTAWQEKVALVTGAGSGIGRGIALTLAQLGVRVAVNYPPGFRSGAEGTLALMAQAGGAHGMLAEADVAEPAAVRAMVEAVVARWGRLDILVNNAAVQPNRTLLEYAEEQFDRVMMVNALGPVWCSQAAAEVMKAQGGGRIIHIVSVHAKRPTDFDPVYAMSKSAVKMLTRETALELGRYQITVNAIAPGAVNIGGPKFGHEADTAPPMKDVPASPPVRRRVDRMVLGRVGEPRDVAAVVAFLASDGAQWLTGSVIRLDGGSMLG